MAMISWSLFRLVGVLALSSCPQAVAFPVRHSSSIARHERLSQQAAAKPNFNGDDGRIEKFQVSSSRGSKAKLVKKSNIKTTDGWSYLKQAIYGTVDGMEAIGAKLLEPKNDQVPVEDGYQEIEQTVLRERGTLSPGQRLMNQYRERSVKNTAPEIPPPPRNAFDALKATVYDGIDVASSVFESNDKPAEKELRRSFKPLVQSTLSSSPDVQQALPDLQSSNIIKRKIAESKIKNWEEKERKRQRQIQREEAARKLKESVYQVGDATVWAAKTLVKAPETVAKVATETTVIVKGSIELAKGTVDQVVTKATAIPVQVTSTVDEVQKTVNESVEKTKQAVEEVKAIPTKIQKSIEDTRKTYTEMKNTVEAAKTNAKVRFGLEKAKPKPPKVPPPAPKSVKELGASLAKAAVTGVVTGTAKVAWWAGTETAKAGWNLAVSTYQDATQKGKGPKAKSTSSDLASVVDKEVEEALLLAQSAIDFADMETSQLQSMDEDNGKKKTP
jgi:hypothetical protein